MLGLESLAVEGLTGRGSDNGNEDIASVEALVFVLYHLLKHLGLDSIVFVR